ncbi:MAG TPA: hypothetical protein VKB47_06320 [Terracidiphilus sp.]|nr:hypothetical protein [Terracidiphilus sp.]
MTKIIVYDPGLSNSPGWDDLSSSKKERLQEKTSKIKRFVGVEQLAQVNRCIELIEVRKLLQGESMTFTTYVKTVFDASKATAFRMLQQYEQIQWPEHLTKYLAERGAVLLRGTTGIGLMELANVSKELPAPKEKDPATLDAFIENTLRPALRERKVARNAGRIVSVTTDDAAKDFFNSARQIMKRARSLNTPAQNRVFLKQVVGWLMEERNISGNLECKRTTIPQGVCAKRGRPVGSGKKQREEAA